MNFRGIVRDCLGGGLHQGLDHAEVLSVLVQNILVSRGPMYRIKEWAQNIEPEALGLTAAQVGGLNDDRLVRGLDGLVEGIPDVWREWAAAYLPRKGHFLLEGYRVLVRVPNSGFVPVVEVSSSA